MHDSPLMDDEDDHWSSTSTFAAASKIQSIQRGNSTRKNDLTAKAALELYDLIGQPTFRSIDFFRRTAGQQDRFVTLARRSLLTTYLSPKTAFQTLHLLRTQSAISHVTFDQFVELSRSKSAESAEQSAEQTTETINHGVLALYNLLDSNPSLINLCQAYANNSQATAAYVRNAQLPCLLTPKTAALGFNYVWSMRQKMSATAPVTQYDGEEEDAKSSSMEERANNDSSSSSSSSSNKENKKMTLDEFASMVNWNVNQIDYAAELFRGLSLYASASGNNKKDLSIVALHRALSHEMGGEEKIANFARSARMECLLSPKSATRAFTHLRSIQDQEEKDSLLTLENFRSLSGLEFSSSPSNQLHLSTSSSHNSALNLASDPITMLCQKMMKIKSEHNTPSSSPLLVLSTWIKYVGVSARPDQRRDEIVLAGLGRLLVPREAARAFQDMTCMLNVERARRRQHSAQASKGGGEGKGGGGEGGEGGSGEGGGGGGGEEQEQEEQAEQTQQQQQQQQQQQ